MKSTPFHPQPRALLVLTTSPADEEKVYRTGLLKIIAGLTVFGLLCLSGIAQPVVTKRVATETAAWHEANTLRNLCPWPGAYVRTVQGTQSMWPAIDEGCILVMGVKPWAETDKGDVLSMTRKLNKTFSKEEYVDAAVLHRAKAKWVKKDGTKVFVLRGDNNTGDDRWYFGQKEYGATVYAVIRYKDVAWSPSMTLSQWQAKVAKQNKLTAASQTR